LEISCAFATSLAAPDHAALAEDIGYDRVWLYDTPQQSPDVWMTLALAARRTGRIGLGPGVLVPSLRHPMVNAAGTATLAALAPGRVRVAFGTGFSSRRAMGLKQIPWSYLDAYVRAFRGLLQGETVEWEGARMRMLHPDGDVAPRPVQVPILIAALGPRGNEIAHQLGDGLFVTLAVPDFISEHRQVSYLFWGTVLDADEAPDSDRLRTAGGPGTALAWHGTYEFGGPDAVAELPGGKEWLAVVDRTPEPYRHLAVHAGHCAELNEADRAAWAAGGSGLLREATVSGSADEVRERIDALVAQGVTEVVYQPCGPDVRRELERFMQAVRR
jgi:5,10-methylenetetrahydromethanopterin reductase